MTRCQPTWRGVKETSRPGLRYKASGCRFPSEGSCVCQLLATLSVALSLALFALGGADPTNRFCLGTLSLGRPTTIILKYTTPFTTFCKGPGSHRLSFNTVGPEE
jgi:hypothetical protein